MEYAMVEVIKDNQSIQKGFIIPVMNDGRSIMLFTDVMGIHLDRDAIKVLSMPLQCLINQ